MNRQKNIKHPSIATDKKLTWLSREYGNDWRSWQEYAAEWVKHRDTNTTNSLAALRHFFITYINERAPYAKDPALFFQGHNGHRASSEDFRTTLANCSAASKEYHNALINLLFFFCDFVIEQHFTEKREDEPTLTTATNPFTPTSNNCGRGSKSERFDWVTGRHGQKWDTWRKYANGWAESVKITKHKENAIRIFLEEYIVTSSDHADVELFIKCNTERSVSTDNLLQEFFKKDRKISYCKTLISTTSQFLDHIIEEHFADQEITNPIIPLGLHLKAISSNPTRSGLSRRYGSQWSQWEQYTHEWLQSLDQGHANRISAINRFFLNYLIPLAPYAHDLKLFFKGHNGHLASSDELREVLDPLPISKRSKDYCINFTIDLVDYIIRKHYPEQAPANQFGIRLSPRTLGVTTDLSLLWLPEYHGNQWKQWQQFAAIWIQNETQGIGLRLAALKCLFVHYLINYAPYAHDPLLFFNGKGGHKVSTDELHRALKEATKIKKSARAEYINAIVDFIDYTIEEHFTSINTTGLPQPTVVNPIKKNGLSNKQTIGNSPKPTTL